VWLYLTKEPLPLDVTVREIDPAEARA